MGRRNYPALYLFTVALFLKGSRTWQLEEDSVDGLTRTQRGERDSSGFCPDGWYTFGEFCYDIRMHGVSWQKADSSCRSTGSYLVSVHSQEEQDFLILLMYEIREKVWIGLSRISPGNEVFTWSDSSALDYTNWVEGEPNNYRNIEGCAHMFFNDCEVGEWNDAPCNAPFRFICKKPKDYTLKKPGRDPSRCRGRNDWLSMRDSCYRIFDKSNSLSSWSQAQSLCKSYGGDLAYVKNAGINKLLEISTKKLQGPFWTGIKGTKKHRYTRLGKNHPLGYSNWQTGQPKEVPDQRNCVALDAEAKWIIRDCAENHPFICEIGPESSESPTLMSYGENMTCSYTSEKWHDVGGKYCYIIQLTEKFKWNEALCRCKEEGGFLASIHSSEEQNIILHYIKHHDMPDIPVFIGLVRDEKGTFGWSDGSAYDYINWAYSEPSSQAEQCVEMDATTGKWNDVYCDVEFGYVCSTVKVPLKTENVPVSERETAELKGEKSQLSRGSITGITLAVLLVALTVLVSVYIFGSALKKKLLDMLNISASSRIEDTPSPKVQAKC